MTGGLRQLSVRRAPRRPRRRAVSRRGFWLGSVLATVALATAGMVVLTATNTVAAPALDHRTQAISAQALAPAACSGLGLTAKVVAGNGGAANELIVGNGNANTINGGGGNDCILAGGGNDTLDGQGGGSDVCDGGPGTDSAPDPIPFVALNGCETRISIP